MRIAQAIVNALIVLAGGQEDEDLTKLARRSTSMPARLVESINRKKQEAADKAIDLAAEHIVSMLDAKTLQVEDLVSQLRIIRNQESKLLGKIRALNLAEDYAIETNNWLPLAVKLDESLTLGKEHKEKIAVPEGWKPKEDKPDTAA